MTGVATNLLLLYLANVLVLLPFFVIDVLNENDGGIVGWLFITSWWAGIWFLLFAPGALLFLLLVMRLPSRWSTRAKRALAVACSPLAGTLWWIAVFNDGFQRNAALAYGAAVCLVFALVLRLWTPLDMSGAWHRTRLV